VTETRATAVTETPVTETPVTETPVTETPVTETGPSDPRSSSIPGSPSATGSGGLSGTLVGVGVGPGDPELVTLKALHILRRADRVVAPSLDETAVGRAEAIVREVAPEVTVERVIFTMSASDIPADASPDDGRPHSALPPAASARAAAGRVAPWLEAGRTVAFVTLGDPAIYSTFWSLVAALADRHIRPSIETVPGIMAFQALAAHQAACLVDGTESLRLVTGLAGQELEPLARDGAALVVYKCGRRLGELAAALERAGRLDGAWHGELLGLPGERVRPLAAVRDQPAAYLSTVIVPPLGRRAAGWRPR